MTEVLTVKVSSFRRLLPCPFQAVALLIPIFYYRRLFLKMKFIKHRDLNSSIRMCQHRWQQGSWSVLLLEAAHEMG